MLPLVLAAFEELIPPQDEGGDGAGGKRLRDGDYAEAVRSPSLPSGCVKLQSDSNDRGLLLHTRLTAHTRTHTHTRTDAKTQREIRLDRRAAPNDAERPAQVTPVSPLAIRFRRSSLAHSLTHPHTLCILHSVEAQRLLLEQARAELEAKTKLRDRYATEKSAEER